MVYERRVTNSLENIFITEQMFWSKLPPTLESVFSTNEPALAIEDKTKMSADDDETSFSFVRA